MSLPLASNGILSAQLGADSCTDDVEAIYVDDAMRVFLHSDAFSLLAQLASPRRWLLLVLGFMGLSWTLVLAKLRPALPFEVLAPKP